MNTDNDVQKSKGTDEAVTGPEVMPPPKKHYGAPIVPLRREIDPHFAKALMADVCGVEWPRGRPGPFKVGAIEMLEEEWEATPVWLRERLMRRPFFIGFRKPAVRAMLALGEESLGLTKKDGGIVKRCQRVVFPLLVALLHEALDSPDPKKVIPKLPRSMGNFTVRELCWEVAEGLPPWAFRESQFDSYENFAATLGDAAKLAHGESVGEHVGDAKVAELQAFAE